MLTEVLLIRLKTVGEHGVCIMLRWKLYVSSLQEGAAIPVIALDPKEKCFIWIGEDKGYEQCHGSRFFFQEEANFLQEWI